MRIDRNARYTEALLREGKDLDYKKWLRQIQEEEAQLKRAAGVHSGEQTLGQPGEPTKAVAAPKTAPPSPTAAPNIQKIPGSRNQISWTETETCKTRKSKRSIAWRLGEVCDEWERFQECRSRDAVYDYLRAVFSIVIHYTVRNRTKRLVQRAYKFAGLPADMKADPFAVVIRATSEQKVDRKTLSKWSRCLRYAAKCKKPRVGLMPFIKHNGGINGCADLFAKELGRHNRATRRK